MATCSQCNHPLPDARTEQEAEAFTKQPCPSCGSFGRTLDVNMVETLAMRDFCGMKLKRQGEKKFAVEDVSRPDFNRDRGKNVHLQRLIDRDNDLYHERITDLESGEVIHEQREPLSEHRGHGAARKKPESS